MKYSINTVTMDDYEDIIKYPKKIGMYKNKDVLIKNGMYGFYISYDEKYQMMNILKDFRGNNLLEIPKCVYYMDKE